MEDEQGVPYWKPFRIEPEFLVVVLAALVHSGDLVLAIPGDKIDAAGVERFKSLGIADLLSFKHVERPRDLPLAALQELFDLLGLQRGLIVNQATREEAVVRLQTQVSTTNSRVALTLGQLQTGLAVCGKPVLSSQDDEAVRGQLGKLKTFLESLQPFNSVGRLKNFPHDAATIQKQRAGLDALAAIEQLSDLLHRTAQAAAYLLSAETLLPLEHPDGVKIRELRTDWQARMADPAQRRAPGFGTQLEQALESGRQLYKDAYVALHQKARLGPNDDKKKGKLAKDARLKMLRDVASIDLMPTQQFRQLENDLLNMKTCYQMSASELDATPYCPHCEYRPSDESLPAGAPTKRLEQIDERLDRLVEEWTKTLLDNLEDPTIKGNVALIASADGKKAVEQFRKVRKLQESVEPAFIKALQEVFSGLEKVLLTDAAMRAALSKGGLPCTLNDARDRIEQYLKDATKGKDPSRVRIVLEEA